MNEGAELAGKLNGLSHFTEWTKEMENCINRTAQALVDAGFPTEAAAFRHAKDVPFQLGGVSNTHFQKAFYHHQLNSSREKLEEVVQRKIS